MKAQGMRVSVALATYNGERFLRDQLNSYLVQSRLPDELCVSDDNSSDGTLQVLKDFQRSAPFTVTIISPQEQLGSNKNFEHACLHCTGDIILFSDQDDVWLPSHIEELVAPLESDPRIVAVASNSTYVDENLVCTGVDLQTAERFSPSERDAIERLSEDQFEHVLRHRMVAGHGMAFKAHILPLLVPFAENWIYDHWVLILAAAAGFITYARQPLTLHREHTSQVVGNKNLTLRDWASRSAHRTNDEERKDESKWRELLTRVREHRDLLKNPEAVEYALAQKVEFVTRRIRIRNAGLPARIALGTRELITGRYHRWGRGILTFGRDLYGKHL